MIKSTAIAATLLVALTTGASAYGPSSPDVDGRQWNQRQRIEQGLRDGSLTRSEYHRLMAEQQRIEAMESRAKRDGHLSWQEREQIRRAQGEASRHIYQERHDYERRGWGWRWRWWRRHH